MIRSIVSCVLLLAVAVQPVLAVSLPCHCFAGHSAESAPAGRFTQQVPPSSGMRACCAAAGRTCAADPATTPVVPRSGKSCCCVQVPKGVLNTELNRVDHREWESLSLILMLPAVADALAIASVPGGAVVESPVRLNGPPLLAMLCVWLK